MKNKKIEIIILTIVLVLQTIIFVIVGANKSYLHMDEAYSLGLASYDKVEIQHNDDFYNNWHNKEYYEDYLSVGKDEVGSFKQVYENQKNDVHPPLYYLFLRIFMGFNIGGFSKWPGIILNIIIFAFITIFMYLILEKIFNSKEKAITVSFISAITMISLTNVIYIRMYALSTLNVLITTFLHMKLLDSQKMNIKLLVCIGIAALVGSLTHYYYLFYLAILYIIFVIIYIKEKRIKELIAYTVAMCIAGVLSIIIFPYSINHMFFGYRGQGAISNLTNITEFINSLKNYIAKINNYAFNNTLWIILAFMLLMIIYKICRRQKVVLEKNKYMKIIIFPTLFYFIIAAVSSPWIELRYVMPVSQLIFVIVLYYLYQLIKNTFTGKIQKIISIAILVIILIMPIIFNIQPEVLYANKRNIVNKVENEYNIPTIYFFDIGHNRFLDDIYLFSILDNSYIAKDIECNEENVQKILENQDLSKGILIFINEGQNNDNILNVVKNTIKASNCEWIERLNNSDVYYLK